MTHKEIAERLRTLFGQGDENMSLTQMEKSMIEALQLANELDPPRPEPGTVVRWRTKFHPEWSLGVVKANYGIVPVAQLGEFWNWNSEGLEWKPARILADDEVPVKVPPVSEWPGDANGLSLDVKWGNEYGLWDSNPIRRVFKITRAEAEKMEAEG